MVKAILYKHFLDLIPTGLYEVNYIWETIEEVAKIHQWVAKKILFCSPDSHTLLTSCKFSPQCLLESLFHCTVPIFLISLQNASSFSLPTKTCLFFSQESTSTEPPWADLIDNPLGPRACLFAHHPSHLCPYYLPPPVRVQQSSPLPSSRLDLLSPCSLFSALQSWRFFGICHLDAKSNGFHILTWDISFC